MSLVAREQIKTMQKEMGHDFSSDQESMEDEIEELEKDMDQVDADANANAESKVDDTKMQGDVK